MERKSLLKNRIKKSQFTAWFFVIVVLLAVSIFLLILNKTWGEIKEPLDQGLSDALPEDSSVNVSEVLDQTSSTTQSFDKLIPFIVIGLFAFVMLLAGAIMKHSIMIVVGVIVLAIIILLAVVYSNLYKNIIDTDEFSDTSDNLPVQKAFMKYMPLIVFILGIAIVVAIVWSKKTSAGGGL